MATAPQKGTCRGYTADVVHLIAHLGGPSSSEDDIEWATDIPAGERLLEWLAAQVHFDVERLPSSVALIHSHNEEPQDLIMRPVLGRIALYAEESNVLDRLPATDESISQNPKSRLASSSYRLPSKLRSCANTLEGEAGALGAHTKRLQHRLQKTKAAMKGLQNAIATIRSEIHGLNQTALEQGQRLTDLSLEADSTVGQCTRQALDVLQNAEQRGRESHLSIARSRIATLERGRCALAIAVERLYRSLDDEYNSLPMADDLHDKAASVYAIIKAASGHLSPSALYAASYHEELGRITSELKGLSQEQARDLEQYIHPLWNSEVEEIDSRNIVPDVKTELERAGTLDRLILSQAQERCLDYITTELRDRLLPGLQKCYEVLQAESALRAETEVIVSALIEELEDVNDGMEEAKRFTDLNGYDSNESGGNPTMILGAAVTDLLKPLLRTDRPIVLLDHSDVESELASFRKSSANAQKAGERWSSQLSRRLTDLSTSQALLLDVAYENSPTNTSAPFAPLPAEVAIVQEIRQRSEDLTTAAARLQRESELSSRDRRKLTAFIEKWSST
ncbi:hypothetical protein BD414DRAFT_422136 [Trametes punicea]|nr:hypothetical protein BD414DRAFT_422136 [Trametes punicea]